MTGGSLDLSQGGHVAFGHRSEFELAQPLSVECWVRFDEPGQCPVVVSCGSWNHSGWFLQKLGNVWRWHVGGIDCDGGQPAVGRRIHIVGVYDGHALRLLQDGVQVAERSGQPNTVVWPGDLYLGQYSAAPGPQYQVQGRISGVKIYHRPIDAKEAAREGKEQAAIAWRHCAVNIELIKLEMNRKALAPVFAAVTMALASQSAAATFFVATNGSNANPGTEANPFATLERARDVIRQHRSSGSLPAGGITVEVRGGTYERSQPFELTERDSGTENAPVVYRARKGESVRFTGGRVVTGWKQVTDAAVLVASTNLPAAKFGKPTCGLRASRTLVTWRQAEEDWNSSFRTNP